MVHAVHTVVVVLETEGQLSSLRLPMCTGTGLLQISSEEENGFIIKYSPSVWKDNQNVWLGMSYDDKGKIAYDLLTVEQ